MRHDPDPRAAPPALAAVLRAVDRVIPEHLLAINDTRLRSRFLVITSIGIGGLILLAMAYRSTQAPFDTSLGIGLAIGACFLALPLLQRLTGSVFAAGASLSAILCLTLPMIQAELGIFPAPSLVFFPAVPLVTTFLCGSRLGLAVTVALGLAIATLGTTLPPAYLPEIAHFAALTAFFTPTSLVIVLLVAVAYDRNRQRNEAELSAAQAVAQAADRRKTEFLRHMSHELRTPLNAILGYSELLQEELAERELPDLGDDLSKIHGASRHLLGLINDLLDISKIEAGVLDLELREFTVDALLAEVGAVVAPLAASGGNRLTLASPSPAMGAPLRLVSDRQRLHQVLLNLAGNACKFTDGGEITISGAPTADGQRIAFTVRDTGVGMTPEDLARIFEPFVQVDASHARRRAGSGLGLMITKHLVELLGGTIAVTSTPGAGSCFAFELPLRARSGADPGAEKTLAEGSRDGRRILEVDMVPPRDLDHP